MAIGEHSGAVTMGEGYSATTEEPARYGHRAFTVPDFPKIRDAAPGASRIDFDTSTMTLQVGDSFGLGDLPSVVASDGDGVVAEAVPVTIDRTSGHASVDWCGNDQKWHVVAPGEIEVTVTGACPTHHRLRATLTIVIRAPSSEQAASDNGATTRSNASPSRKRTGTSGRKAEPDERVVVPRGGVEPPRHEDTGT